ncbi:MAG: hypothetical protein OET55_00665, partial [Desulfuromonadales bacterium]|nr:hypothetical protein [Desulfuromonadales bacterium]
VEAAMREDRVLYSESASRLLVTVKEENSEPFEKLFAGQIFACIGEVTADEDLTITGLQGEVLIRSTIDDLKEAWQSPLREM